MKIIFKESIAGPNYAYAPGDKAEFEEKQAIRFCEAGIAIPVKEENVETQAKTSEEKSSKKYPYHKGGGYYELSNGETIQGKEEAIAEEEKLG